MPLVPWHRLVICSHLLLLCGGLLLALFVVLPLLDPPFLVWAVLSLPSVWFLVCSLVPPSVTAFGASSLLLLGFRFCCLLLCCEVAPLPRWLLSPSPPSVVPLRCPGPVFCAGPSLWVSGCFMRRPGCLALMPGCCGALLPRFILLHGSKGLWPCVGFCVTLYTMVHLLLWSSVLLH